MAVDSAAASVGTTAGAAARVAILGEARVLVLTRKVGEAIRIGTDVTVQVLEVRGGQIRLGLTAPAGVRILREEVLRAKDGAANGQSDTLQDGDGPGASMPKSR